MIKPNSDRNEKILQIKKEHTTKLEAREVMSTNFVTRSLPLFSNPFAGTTQRYSVRISLSPSGALCTSEG